MAGDLEVDLLSQVVATAIVSSDTSTFLAHAMLTYFSDQRHEAVIDRTASRSTADAQLLQQAAASKAGSMGIVSLAMLTLTVEDALTLATMIKLGRQRKLPGQPVRKLIADAIGQLRMLQSKAGQIALAGVSDATMTALQRYKQDVLAQVRIARTQPPRTAGGSAGQAIAGDLLFGVMERAASPGHYGIARALQELQKIDLTTPAQLDALGQALDRFADFVQQRLATSTDRLTAAMNAGGSGGGVGGGFVGGSGGAPAATFNTGTFGASPGTAGLPGALPGKTIFPG